MWCWHRKHACGTDGLALIKQGEVLKEIPDWRDRLPIVARRRTVPRLIAEDPRSSQDRLFDVLTGDKTPLDAEHNRLLDWLREQDAPASWNQDQHMLVTHTYWLKEAHKALRLKGPFETVSTGRNKTSDINCFAYPRQGGAWVVRRYTPGVAEAATWGKDTSGWTRCFLNRDPGLRAKGRPGYSFTLPLLAPTSPTGEQ